MVSCAPVNDAGRPIWHKKRQERKNTRGKGDGHRIVGEDFPLFEILASSFARDPKSLIPVARLVKRLSTDEGETLVPTEFMSVWQVFAEAMVKGGINVNRI